MAKSITENVRAVRARIERAAEKVGREPGAVRILAAGKNRSAPDILEAVDAGIEIVGENRVQELLAKEGDVGDRIDWHFIGHLQRNKVKYIIGLVSLVHSVDSVRVAEEINRRAEREGKIQPVLLQVNVAGEQSKFGVDPDDARGVLEELTDCRQIEFRGLSTIAPLVQDPEQVRWVFRDLKEIGRRLEVLKNFDCRELSMGMTNDFEVAVEEGSTIVRIGSAIFDRD